MEFNVNSLLNYTIDDAEFSPLLNLFQITAKNELELIEESEKILSSIPLLPSSSYAELLEKEKNLIYQIKMHNFALEIKEKLETLKDYNPNELSEVILQNRSLSKLLKWIAESEIDVDFNKDSHFRNYISDYIPSFIKKYFFDLQIIIWEEIKEKTGYPIEKTEGGRDSISFAKNSPKINEYLNFMQAFTEITEGAEKIGINSNSLKGIDFLDLKVGVRFHFLGEQQTNRIDKPEWMFAYIEDLIGMNVGYLREIGLEEEAAIALGRMMLEDFYEEVEIRFQNDYDFLKNNDLTLLHFIDSLNCFENNMGRLLPPSASYQPHPSLFERLIVIRPPAFTQLLSCEYTLFDQKIFSASSSSTLTSLIENYCVLYKKLYQKYDLISNQDFLNKIHALYFDDIFQNLLKILSSLLSQAPLDQLYQTISTLKNFYKSLTSSSIFAGELILLRDFKHSQLHEKIYQIVFHKTKILIKESKNLFKELFGNKNPQLSQYRTIIAKEVRETKFIQTFIGGKIRGIMMRKFWELWLEEIIGKVKWNEKVLEFGVDAYEVVIEEIRRIGGREDREGIEGKMREAAELMKGGKGERLSPDERNNVLKANVIN